MTEYLDILDARGNKTGETKPKSDVHRDGDWHRTAYVWFLNSKGEILLQKRSLKKQTGGGLWDISAAGHVSAGQTSIEAAIRETKEEIGVDIGPDYLQFICTVAAEGKPRTNPTFWNREYQDSYLVRRDLDISKLKLQKSEVDEVKFVDIHEFKKWALEERPDLVRHKDGYVKLFEFLKV